ncbi:MAG TPA: DUF2267 domain-containing protein [Solirubrobacteraceae bacterium]|jgi:uncharacterized protein (DUF2267 family)
MAEPHTGQMTQSAADAAYERFIAIVQDAAGLEREPAERATRVVLQTLAERLSGGEARDIAEQLPPDLAAWLRPEGRAEPFEVDEFLRRIADREHVDPRVAERHARAVLLALGQTITADELADMAAELPKSFAPLLPRGERIEVMPAETFLGRVAQRTALAPDEALRAASAVLETLAERVSGGEVEDLMAQLPPQLQEPLRRGDALSNGAARKMTLEEFVRAVAEREAVTPPEAREHTRAVLATLREAITPKEWFDMTSQLPDEYRAVLARP